MKHENKQTIIIANKTIKETASKTNKVLSLKQTKKQIKPEMREQCLIHKTRKYFEI